MTTLVTQPDAAGLPSAHTAPTTGPARRSAVGRRHLPGPVRASIGLPRAETVVFVAVVPLLRVPVLLATMAAAWAAAVALVLTAVVAWLCLARRVVVGRNWVADRRLWRYRVTTDSQLRAVELAENGHGGLDRLHPQTGRTYRLGRAEYAAEPVRAALSFVIANSPAQLGTSVPAALGLPAAQPATEVGVRA